MTKKSKVKMNRRGAIAVLKSDGVRDDIQRRVNAIASTAGDGFVGRVSYGRDRVLGNVHAETPEAMRAESEDRALTSALDAGR